MEVPCRAGIARHVGAEPVPDGFLFVPEVSYAWVGHAIAIPAVASVAEEHVEPHCVHAQIRIGILAQDVLRRYGGCAWSDCLARGCPPRTRGSARPRCRRGPLDP